MTRNSLLAGCLLVAGCGENSAPSVSTNGDSGAALERQAIAQGLLPDPVSRTFSGRFETRSELGTDKFCAVGDGADYVIGVLAVFGPESKCEARGTANFKGDSVSIRLDGKDQCAFDAGYDGIVLRFPGIVPEGCASYCSRNASMSGTRYYFVDPGNEAAKKTLGREIERLCR